MTNKVMTNRDCIFLLRAMADQAKAAGESLLAEYLSEAAAKAALAHADDLIAAAAFSRKFRSEVES